MIETPFFFPRGEARLFGLLHEPAADPSGLGFVLSHPFAEEKLWSHRVLVSMARGLCARGHAVLRFDYTGAGDSSGTALDTDLATHLADLAAAIALLPARVPAVQRVGMLGLRLGASVAALLADRAATDASLAAVRGAPLVLWEPVVDGAAYFQDVMRGHLSMQLASLGKVVETREVLSQRIVAGGSVNVDGYEIGKALFESAGRADLLPAGPRDHTGPALVMAVAPAARAKPRPDLERLAAGYASGALATADEQPFWREIKPFYGRAERLQAATLAWLSALDD